MSNHATLRDAILYFADFEHCKDFMVQLRWLDGVVNGATKVTCLAKQRVWKCYERQERPRFSLKTGTIFEDSPIALEKWLPAVWMLLNCKNGISSYELHRGLGVTQKKTAWFMLSRIRPASQKQNKAADMTKAISHIDARKIYIESLTPSEKTKLKTGKNNLPSLPERKRDPSSYEASAEV